MKTWVEISKKNLLHNVEQFLSLLKPETQFMAVVKSNAYGHGIREVSRILSGYKTDSEPIRSYPLNIRSAVREHHIWFGVDNLDEAAVVREVAPKSPVLVLGYTQNERLREAAKLGARVTVYNWETVKALKKCRMQNSECRIRVHVKIETGTTRQGIGEDEAVEFIKALKKIRGVEVEGISTHFADSEDLQSEYALRQLERYNGILKSLERAKIRMPIQHTACTAATLRLPQAHGNLVRVGIGLYGMWPSVEVKMQNEECRTENGRIQLKPVLTWKTIVAQVKEVKKGTPISYDLTERVARDSKIAVLPIGYWDGFDRGLSKIGFVLIGGKRCKILGRVCMNMCVADITGVRGVKPEDEVVLLGTQGRSEITADEIAKQLNTIHWEVVTRINTVLPRIVV